MQRRDGFGREPQLRQGAAGHQLAGHLGQGHAGGLGHKRHGAGGTGICLDDEHPLALLRVDLHCKLQVDQAAHPEGQGQGPAPLADRGQGCLAQAHRRQPAGRIARMDARRLDVLHHTADHHYPLPIAKGIHIHFDGVIEVLVDQHWVVGLHLHRFHHVAVELGFVVDDLHGAPAQHVAGAHNHWIAHARSDGPGLGLTAGQAIAGLADLQPAQDRFKLLPVFGGVDRFR